MRRVSVIALALVAASAAMAEGGPSVLAIATGPIPVGETAWLSAALARSPSIGAVIAWPEALAAEGEPSGGLGEALDYAARAGCALVAQADSSIAEGGEARSEWRLIAVAATPGTLAGAVLAEGVIEGAAPTRRDLAAFWWLPLVAAAETALAALPPPGAATLAVEGPAGALVAGLSEDPGAEPVVIPATGRLLLSVRPPATLRWRATATGYRPASGALAVMADGQTLSLGLSPLKNAAVELGLSAFQYPDLYAGASLADGYLWLGAGLGQYALGLRLVDARREDPSPSYLASAALFLPSLAARAYALPPDAFLRPYLVFEAALRLYLPWAAPPALEPAAPFALKAAIGGEWSFSRDVAAFLELGGAFYPAADGFLMAAMRGIEQRGPRMEASGETWFAELLPPRGGLRVYLW